VDEAVDQEHLDRLRTEAEAKLTEWREQIDAINDQLRLDVSDFDLPPIQIPESEVNGASALAVSRFPVDVCCAVHGAEGLEVLQARRVIMIDTNEEWPTAEPSSSDLHQNPRANARTRRSRHSKKCRRS
jgi:hypothetical protein